MSTLNIKKNTRSIIIGLLLSWSSLVQPQTQPEPESLASGSEIFTPEQLVSWVLDRNPGITELSAAADVAVFRVEPAGSLDDPTFGYTIAPRTFGREGQGLNQKIEFSQSLPWPGKLAARKAVAEHEATMAHKDVEALRLKLAATAKSAYAEWYFIERALTIHHTTHELLDELRSVAESHYAAGMGLQQAAIQAEVEQANLQRHLLKLKRIETSIQAQINALMNRDTATPLPAPADITIPREIPTLAQLEHQALEAHPELRRLDSQIAAHTAHVTLAEKAFYPDFRLSAGYNSLWDEPDKRPVIGLSINIPFDRSKRRAELSSAKANVIRSEAQRDDQRTQLLGELAQAHAKLLESVDAAALYESSLMPLANDYFDATLAEYQSGAGSFLAVITAEQRKLATEEELERNRADILRSTAELERWIGRSIEPQNQSQQGEQL